MATVNAGPQQVAYPLPNQCPNCGGPNIQKVTGLVSSHSGTTSTQTAGIGVGTIGGAGAIGGGISQSTSRSLSDLAKLLSQPKPIPHKTAPTSAASGCFGCTGVLLLLVAIGTVMDTARQSEAMPLWLSGGLGLFCLILGLLLIPKINQETEALKPTNREIDQRNHARHLVWDRAYYCHKCDHVFDPATNRRAPASNAADLWA